MRYLFLSILLICCPVCLRAQAWFCTDEGTELVYTRYYAEDGSVKWNHTMNILETALDSADSSLTVTYSSFIRTVDGKGLENMETPAVMTALISRDGDVTLDIAASLTPGDTLQSAAGKVRALGMTMNVTVTERRVLGTDTLTTPAGTFPCVIVSEHKVEKGMMRNRITTARTWYARGVGMVRHDTYDRNLKIETTEVLEKIVRK